MRGTISDLSTLTLHLPRATTDKLERLAGQRHTTRDALVSEALVDFADWELAIVSSIERGRAEIDAGFGLETDDVFRDVEAAIVAAEADRTEPCSGRSSGRRPRAATFSPSPPTIRGRHAP